MTDLLLKQKTANALLKMAINMHVSFTGDTCLFSRCMHCVINSMDITEMPGPELGGCVVFNIIVIIP